MSDERWGGTFRNVKRSDSLNKYGSRVRGRKLKKEELRGKCGVSLGTRALVAKFALLRAAKPTVVSRVSFVPSPLQIIRVLAQNLPLIPQY